MTKLVLITGGAGALGQAIACGFSGDEFEVVVTSRRLSKAEQAAESLRQRGVHASGKSLEVSERGSLMALRDYFSNANGSLWTVIHCAGGNRAEANITDSTRLDSEDLFAAYEAVLEQNLSGTVRLNLIFAELLLRQSSPASIVNIGSVSGLTPLSRVGFYSLAKAGVHSWTKFLATSLAGTYGRADLRANVLVPGFFPADQNRNLLQDESGELSSRGRAIVGGTPAGRFGNPVELSGAARFLADERQSSFVTGQLLTVDGGFTSFAI